MIEGLISLEKAALERLTEDRISSGGLSPEVEELLSSAGVYWDEIGQEYFSIDNFQKETFARLALEYTNENYA
jgi:hypothetical protein|tara:strand:+ start:778 stop:996 length:219 start_codon:yes stop_codon:yes gene_type:complete